MPAIIDVRFSLGTILIGCFIAVALSGVVAFQACIYFRLYPQDRSMNKRMVAVVWMLDIAHTVLICTSVWIYLIANFGNIQAHVEGVVPVTISIGIGITAFIALITQAYFLQRLLHLSKNRFLVYSTWLLVLGRVTCGLITTVTLAHYQNFPKFTARYPTVFTLGLVFSSAADVTITFGMCFYLQENRRGLGTIDDIIDSVIIYTINNGTLTCILTIVSLVCWLTMRRNLIFMALYFAIAKMYTNSLLGTLNMRKSFRGRAHPPKEPVNWMPVLLPDSFNRNNRGGRIPDETFEFTDTMTPQPAVKKTEAVQYDDNHGFGPLSPQTSPVPFELKNIGGAGTFV